MGVAQLILHLHSHPFARINIVHKLLRKALFKFGLRIANSTQNKSGPWA